MDPDSVQLRPMVRPMGKALEYDKSLFERLWKGPNQTKLSRTMLDVRRRHILPSFGRSLIHGNRSSTDFRQTLLIFPLASFTKGDSKLVIRAKRKSRRPSDLAHFLGRKRKTETSFPSSLFLVGQKRTSDAPPKAMQVRWLWQSISCPSYGHHSTSTLLIIETSFYDCRNSLSDCSLHIHAKSSYSPRRLGRMITR